MFLFIYFYIWSKMHHFKTEILIVTLNLDPNLYSVKLDFFDIFIFSMYGQHKFYSKSRYLVHTLLALDCQTLHLVIMMSHLIKLIEFLYHKKRI